MPAKTKSTGGASKKASGSKSKSKSQGDRCWKGYEPTPGKAPGSKGSCKKKSG